MSLSNEQWEFLKDVAALIYYADHRPAKDYKLTGAELYRTPEQAALNAKKGSGIKNSLHTQRLAIDLNLFIDGEYRTDTKAYRELGEFWKGLSPNNRWGGDFSRPDGNHFERNA
jgi:hypothetical protein